MMATRKVNYQANQEENLAFLNSIRQVQEERKEEMSVSESVGKASCSDDEKVLVNFKMNKSKLEELRLYCKDNDMTLTAGIKRAIRLMLEQE